MSTNKRLAGFTLIELLVAMIISSILISVTSSTYLLFRRSLARDQAKADITQNARIALDRMSREIRQSRGIITDLPNTISDISVAEPHEIEFNDGHLELGDPTFPSNRRYYVSNGVLKLDIRQYSLNNVPILYLGPDGSSPTMAVLSTQDVAERVSDLSFYGTGSIFLAYITTTDGETQNYTLTSTIIKRN